MQGANENTLRSQETIDTVTSKLVELSSILKDEEHKVLIHCSAGIHRTGTIAYTLLRINGYDKEGAREAINKMRKESGEGVGENRIDIAEELYVTKILG